MRAHTRRNINKHACNNIMENSYILINAKTNILYGKLCILQGVAFHSPAFSYKGWRRSMVRANRSSITLSLFGMLGAIQTDKANIRHLRCNIIHRKHIINIYSFVSTHRNILISVIINTYKGISRKTEEYG